MAACLIYNYDMARHIGHFQPVPVIKNVNQLRTFGHCMSSKYHSKVAHFVSRGSRIRRYPAPDELQEGVCELF